MLQTLVIITIDDGDSDGDGLSDIQEEDLGTNPQNPDSDVRPAMPPPTMTTSVVMSPPRRTPW